MSGIFHSEVAINAREFFRCQRVRAVSQRALRNEWPLMVEFSNSGIFKLGLLYANALRDL